MSVDLGHFTLLEPVFMVANEISVTMETELPGEPAKDLQAPETKPRITFMASGYRVNLVRPSVSVETDGIDSWVAYHKEDSCQTWGSYNPETEVLSYQSIILILNEPAVRRIIKEALQKEICTGN